MLPVNSVALRFRIRNVVVNTTERSVAEHNKCINDDTNHSGIYVYGLYIYRFIFAFRFWRMLSWICLLTLTYSLGLVHTYESLLCVFLSHRPVCFVFYFDFSTFSADNITINQSYSNNNDTFTLCVSLNKYTTMYCKQKLRKIYATASLVKV